MNTHFTKILTVIGFTVVAALAAHAVPSSVSTGTATATAEIVAGIQIIHLNAADLKFGQVIPSIYGDGTVTIAPDSSRTYAGVDVINSNSYTAAHFKVSGAANTSFGITLPTSIYLQLSEDASVTMLVDQFTSNPSGNGMLDATGAANLDVGATLHVHANQRHGRYDAPFSVTVAYN